MGAMHDTQKMMHQNWEMELDDDEYEKLEQENELTDSRLIDRYAQALNDREFNMQEGDLNEITTNEDEWDDKLWAMTDTQNMMHQDHELDQFDKEQYSNSQIVSQAELDDPRLSPGALKRLTAVRADQLNMIGKDGASRSRALRQIVQGAGHGHGHGHHHHHNKKHGNDSTIAAGLLNKFESYDNHSMRQYIDIANGNDIITELEVTQAELDDPNLSPKARERLINLIKTQRGHGCFSDYCNKEKDEKPDVTWRKVLRKRTSPNHKH
jgi:hypothetical protein